MDDYELNKMTPRVRAKYLQIIRSMPPGKRLRIAIEHNEAVHEFVKAGIRAQNPGVSEEHVHRELVRRILPPDIVKKVYGW